MTVSWTESLWNVKPSIKSHRTACENALLATPLGEKCSAGMTLLSDCVREADPWSLQSCTHSYTPSWHFGAHMILSSSLQFWGHFQSLDYKLILFESMCIQSATAAHFQENTQFWLKGCMSLPPPPPSLFERLKHSLGIVWGFCSFLWRESEREKKKMSDGVVITFPMIIIPCQFCHTEEVKCTAG